MNIEKLVLRMFNVPKYLFSLLAVVIFLLNVVCLKGQDKKNKATEPKNRKSIVATIDLSKSYQSIDHFGASDAWSAQFIGNWPDVKKNAIADLLFSTGFTSEGKAKGIGLSIWRFNIGAGSAQQAEQSGIKDEWRRAESFLADDNTYNWKRQAGQMWFLQAAKARGVNQFLAFTNSPPVQLTINGKAYANLGKPNLSPDKFDAFSDFLINVVKGVKNKTGVLFNYISPANEPQWDWSNGGQEGTPFTNKDISGIAKSLNAKLLKENLSSKISITDAGQYNFLYSDNDKPDKGKQIDFFFNPNSSGFIGDLERLDKTISGHSYFTTSPFSKAVSVRKELADKVSTIQGLKFWQSEYCILGDNAGEINGRKRDLGITPALYTAKIIHNDLVTANATAWHWWVAISPYDYKDGLIYVDKNKSDGNYYASKMLWALGNYSHFIRPGSIRVDVSLADLPFSNGELLVSSYKNQSTNQLITVIVNADDNAIELKLDVKNGQLSEIRPYITSAENDMKPQNIIKAVDPVIIQPRSITTLVGIIK